MLVTREHLTAGAITGAVIGSLCGASILALCLLFFIFRALRKRNARGVQHDKQDVSSEMGIGPIPPPAVSRSESPPTVYPTYLPAGRLTPPSSDVGYASPGNPTAKDYNVTGSPTSPTSPTYTASPAYQTAAPRLPTTLLSPPPDGGIPSPAATSTPTSDVTAYDAAPGQTGPPPPHPVQNGAFVSQQRQASWDPGSLAPSRQATTIVSDGATPESGSAVASPTRTSNLTWHQHPAKKTKHAIADAILDVFGFPRRATRQSSTRSVVEEADYIAQWPWAVPHHDDEPVVAPPVAMPGKIDEADIELRGAAYEYYHPSTEEESPPSDPSSPPPPLPPLLSAALPASPQVPSSAAPATADARLLRNFAVLPNQSSSVMGGGLVDEPEELGYTPAKATLLTSSAGSRDSYLFRQKKTGLSFESSARFESLPPQTFLEDLPGTHFDGGPVKLEPSANPMDLMRPTTETEKHWKIHQDLDRLSQSPPPTSQPVHAHHTTIDPSLLSSQSMLKPEPIIPEDPLHYPPFSHTPEPPPLPSLVPEPAQICPKAAISPPIKLESTPEPRPVTNYPLQHQHNSYFLGPMNVAGPDIHVNRHASGDDMDAHTSDISTPPPAGALSHSSGPSNPNTPDTHVTEPTTVSPFASPLFSHHQQQHTTNGVGPSPRVSPEPIVCECGRAFDQLHKLNHHRRYHDRPHECPHEGCGKRFGTKTHLDRHINDKHNKTRKYYCQVPDCLFSRQGGRSFPRKDNWRRHMLNKHQITPQSDPGPDYTDERMGET